MKGKKCEALQKAKANGADYYFTGEPCLRGHIAERHTKTRTCMLCRAIHKYSRSRDASKMNATPAWVDMEVIKDIYRNRPKNMTVDHIVPLQNEKVCGLHVPWNLQYLSPSENSSKGNKFE